LIARSGGRRQNRRHTFLLGLGMPKGKLPDRSAGLSPLSFVLLVALGALLKLMHLTRHGPIDGIGRKLRRFTPARRSCLHVERRGIEDLHVDATRLLESVAPRSRLGHLHIHVTKIRLVLLEL
jgi:hypothetical protein